MSSFNQSVADRPYFIAFYHDQWDVKTHEETLTGRKVTVVKYPSSMVAYHQLQYAVKELKATLWSEEGEEE